MTSAWSNLGSARRAAPNAAAEPSSALSSFTAHHCTTVAFGNSFSRRSRAASIEGEPLGSATTTSPAPPSFFHSVRRASSHASNALASDGLPSRIAMRLRSGS